MQVTDDDVDEDAGSQGCLVSSQALHVLPFYSLLPSDRQAKVCITRHYFCIHCTLSVVAVLRITYLIICDHV